MFENKKRDIREIGENEKNTNFTKKVGIVFLENIKNKKEKIHLDFDQEACSYFMLQMNSVQTLFNFNIISNFIETLPDTTNNIEEWFVENVRKYESKHRNHVDYWILIMAHPFENNWFFKTPLKNNRMFSIITSSKWEEAFSPPSLFEYLSVTTFTCALLSLGVEYNGNLRSHSGTRGCILDFTDWKSHRRVLVANPQICSDCKERILEIENNIRHSGIETNIFSNLNNIIARNWMGDLKSRDTPIFNLKKIYGYNVDANSGFYKKWKERVRDNFKDHIIEWISVAAIGTIISTVATIMSKTSP